MHFGEPGTINSSVSSQGIAVVATPQKKPTQRSYDDRVWDEIFDNLVIESEPPIEYIKQVTIKTKDGSLHRVSPKHFAKIIEQERHLTPEESEIRSCKMSINFRKLRDDVDAWTDDLIKRLDGTPDRRTPRKPAARKAAPRKATASKTKTKKT